MIIPELMRVEEERVSGTSRVCPLPAGRGAAEFHAMKIFPHVILKMDMELRIERLSGPEALADIASQWESLDAQIFPRAPFTSPGDAIGAKSSRFELFPDDEHRIMPGSRFNLRRSPKKCGR
jgi:hypothetical protein